jgi:hypothetical protein
VPVPATQQPFVMSPPAYQGNAVQQPWGISAQQPVYSAPQPVYQAQPPVTQQQPSVWSGQQPVIMWPQPVAPSISPSISPSIGILRVPGAVWQSQTITRTHLCPLMHGHRVVIWPRGARRRLGAIVIGQLPDKQASYPEQQIMVLYGSAAVMTRVTQIHWLIRWIETSRTLD